MSNRKCAIWARVSTEEQHADNQLPVLRAWAASCGFEVAAEFITEDSAWTATAGNGKGKAFDKARSAMLAGVRAGTYDVVLCWDIDRLSRRGSEDMQRYLRLLAEAGADVRSHEQAWLNTADPFAREMLVGIFATLARYQSQHRSEQIKAGLARRRAEGKPVGGRQKGAKDRKPREREGYMARQARERAEREQDRTEAGERP